MARKKTKGDGSEGHGPDDGDDEEPEATGPDVNADAPEGDAPPRLDPMRARMAREEQARETIKADQAAEINPGVDEDATGFERKGPHGSPTAPPEAPDRSGIDGPGGPQAGSGEPGTASPQGEGDRLPTLGKIAGNVDGAADDPAREPSPGETAANVEVLAKKGDLQPGPVTPATATPRRAPRVSPGASGGSRSFVVVSGVVQGFRAAGPGQPKTIATERELNLPEESIKRLVDHGVLAETDPRS